MIRVGTLVLFAVAALTACSTTGVYPSQTGVAWKDADDDGVPLQKGAKECKYQAMISAASATGVAKQADVAGDLYEQCMRGRGY